MVSSSRLALLLLAAAAVTAFNAPPLSSSSIQRSGACATRPTRCSSVVACADAAAEAAAAAASEAAFTSLAPSLPASVVANLAARNVMTPTPIQSAAIPRAVTGESIVLHAETGSGKSLAFLLPALVRLGLAGAEELPKDPEIGKVLVIAPTRELAVQLANEAAVLIPAPSAVQIVAVGATPDPVALLNAAVITCTAQELLRLLEAAGEGSGVVDAVLSQVRVLVLDELDTLLPISSVYGAKAAQRKKAAIKKKSAQKGPPAEELVRAVMEASSFDDLQLLAASATVSRPVRMKLSRVLRRDPIARWYDTPPDIVRPNDLTAADLSQVARAVVIPSGVRHYYYPLESSVKLRRMTPKAAKRPQSKRRLTLKQKRAAKELARRAAKGVPTAEQTHPLLVKLADAMNAVAPRSALVFLCRSSGLTVRRASREMKRLGIKAMALHEAIGLEHAPPTIVEGAADAPAPALRRRAKSDTEEGEEGGEGGEAADTSGALRLRHRAVSDAFTSQLSAQQQQEQQQQEQEEEEAAASAERPVLVTFEDMARGLHFDGVDAVFILGLPDSPATYLHLAGRTGRQPVLEGSVITISPGKSQEVLLSWSGQLGGVKFEELESRWGAEEEEVEEATMEAADETLPV